MNDLADSQLLSSGVSMHVKKLNFSTEEEVEQLRTSENTY